MRAWKQVDETDADYLEVGSLKLGTWEDYAELENGRADRYDGGVAMHSGSLHGSRPDHVAAMKRMGLIHAETPLHRLQNVLVQRTTVVSVLPAMPVFCMTECGNRFDPSPERPKATFEVLGVNCLASRLLELYPDKLARYRARRVAYAQVEFNAMNDEALPDPDPFLKGERFRAEREIRLVFEPPTDVEGKTLYTAPDPAVARPLRRVA